MLYNQLLESISIEATVGTLRLSTPTYIPYDLQSSIKKLIPSPRWPSIKEYCLVIRFVPWNGIHIC